MREYRRFIPVLAAVAALNVQAARDCYVVRRSGQKVRGEALAAESDGTLQLKLGSSGPVQTFKPGTYLYGYIPKPKAVSDLERAFEGGSYDDVVKYAPAIFEKYKYLGWGDHVSYMEGMVYIDRKNYTQAQQAFERGSRFQAGHGEELVKGMVLALLGQKKIDEVQPMLERMMKAPDADAAAFAFNARGRILVQQGRKKEAVLEFLKALLLFRPGTAEREREDARKQVVALLEELKDPRWKEFEKLE